jgi:NTP pyrophosphatase (non-canonical NTP hydrolase)
MLVLGDITVERDRQEKLCKAGKFPWTCANVQHNAFEKLPILGEEVGEVSRVMSEYLIGNLTGDERNSELYKELIQVAAVAAAWCEALIQERAR